eukprot:TRINITY_DN81670_c0_g1_i1.p1 TRINITY_DN81670_c0_g1~~TRINITY_DN81670_c0_g1_i1.p1  ORF type:complete len:255 (-),score=47.21 TRINITY_DN81670_c0_g1_i1:225-989(-)
MCWSWNTAGLFALAQYGVALWLYKRQRTIRDTSYSILLLCFGTMELIQAFSWFVIEPLDNLNKPGFRCNKTNKILTFLAMAHIYFQPTTFAVVGYVSNSKFAKERFLIPLTMGIITFVTAMISAVLGEYFNFLVWQADDSMEGIETCSYEGEHGHILWKWAMSHSMNLPNYFPYLLGSVCLFFMKPKRVAINLVICFWGMCFLSFWWVEASPEGASFWCWTTVCTVIFPIIEPIFWDVDTEKKQFIEELKQKNE